MFTENSAHQKVVETFKDSFVQSVGRSGVNSLLDLLDIALLEEIQLAIYARSWELSHPGDLVVAAGISVIGHNTQHFIEKSKNYTQNSQIKIGKITNLSSKMYRFPNEDAAPKSDPFRAWLSQRLLTASRAAEMAYSGHVVPTPSESSCRFCKVRNACDARVEVNRI